MRCTEEGDVYFVCGISVSVGHPPCDEILNNQRSARQSMQKPTPVHDMVRCGTVQYSTVHFSTGQYITVPSTTVNYTAVYGDSFQISNWPTVPPCMLACMERIVTLFRARKAIETILFRWTLHIKDYPLRFVGATAVQLGRHQSAYHCARKASIQSNRVHTTQQRRQVSSLQPEISTHGPALSKARQRYRLLGSYSFVRGTPLV